MCVYSPPPPPSHHTLFLLLSSQGFSGQWYVYLVRYVILFSYIIPIRWGVCYMSMYTCTCTFVHTCTVTHSTCASYTVCHVCVYSGIIIHTSAHQNHCLHALHMFMLKSWVRCPSPVSVRPSGRVWDFMTATYRIVLICRRSKCLQIAVFDKISWIRCRSWWWCEVSKFSLKYFHKWHRICKNCENLDPQNIHVCKCYTV